jgi:integrase
MQTRTKGIQLADSGDRTVNKQYRGERIFARLGAVSQDEAESWLREQQNGIDRKAAQGVQHHFCDAAEKYLKEKEADGEGTHDYAAGHLAKILPYIGDKPLQSIHNGTLSKFISDRLTPKIKAGGVVKILSPDTVNKTLEVVRTVLIRSARVWRNDDGTPWLASAPLIELLENKNRRQPYPITWEEQDYLFQELPPHIERMASFAVNTGVRAENVCNLKWDWEQQLPEIGRSVFVIPASEFKSGRSHVVILNDAAQAVIQSMREKHEVYVFPFRGDRVWEMGNNGWKQARERAGLPKVRVHDLRHTFGMRLRYAGVSEEDRALLLGHATKSMPQHYATAIVERLVEQANKVRRSERPMTILRVVNG